MMKETRSGIRIDATGKQPMKAALELAISSTVVRLLLQPLLLLIEGAGG